MQFSVIATILAISAGVFAAPSAPCPEITDKSPTTFLSDNASCSTFYICDRSGPIKYECPKGLEFSKTNWVCVDPKDAACSL
ncbi:hypothetical protein FPQ18DRAFT_313170 [Pyronema domesticum]|uniref:Chitin-binding type-2 domain-containing protein n=1 Tax=Pyronema omphalodes (strain CBS 100304) TaxID=1076935 RepID=U4LFU3_PYROM|nr:hypothetical protein FPQ18DRAFT_313170 [Pyronema domesticum]KAI5813482.1 hypothetical protein BZA77DRAFT_357861 [Pyronema omphalodes]CCX14322.1 Similar to hypothetical protein DAPPUDRAFT_315108 [Daphnia pulex]; acc. no. EFX84019 [Pyronema omphalodes CBS 100304]